MASPLKLLLLKCVATVIALAAVGIEVFMALLSHEHRSELKLPVPTGHFAVGRTSYTWVNEAQPDELAPTAGVKRQVLVWMWYPSRPGQLGRPAEYLPSYWREAASRTAGPRSVPAILMNDYLTHDYANVQTNSLANVPLSPEQSSYPVVIMRPGLGALTTEFTTLAEDLASHGYVVVGFDAPYRTSVVVFPDGRVIRRPPEYNPETLPENKAERLAERLMVMWVDDTRFVVDQLERLNSADPDARFTGRLDLAHVGAFGHSLGGATALQFCHDDARCKAGIDIDGQLFGSVLSEGTSQPFMFLFSSAGNFKVAQADREIFTRIRSVYERLPNGRWLLAVRGTNHFSFGDQALLKSHYVIRALQGVDARRGLSITTAYVHTFFDVCLKDESADLLDTLGKTYPEVQAIEQQ